MSHFTFFRSRDSFLNLNCHFNGSRSRDNFANFRFYFYKVTWRIFTFESLFCVLVKSIAGNPVKTLVFKNVFKFLIIKLCFSTPCTPQIYYFPVPTTFIFQTIIKLIKRSFYLSVLLNEQFSNIWNCSLGITFTWVVLYPI